MTVRVRFRGLRSVTRAATVPSPISTTRVLTELAIELAGIALADNPRERLISLLGVSVSNLVDEPALQLALPLPGLSDRYQPGSRLGAARWAADHSVDAIRARFGRAAIGYADRGVLGRGTSTGGLPGAGGTRHEAGAKKRKRAP